MGKLFGTDGIRGKANKTLTVELAYRLGRAAAIVLAEQKPEPVFFIGKDTRISGDMLEAALAAGLASAGANVFLLGVIPTPGVAYLVKNKKADAGAVISASHNPAQDNGIKFFAENGYKLSDAMEAEIEEFLLEQRPWPNFENIIPGRIQNAFSYIDDYRIYLEEKFPLQLNRHNIVIDGANGAASNIAPQLFTHLGASVKAICCHPNGLNINHDCGSTHPEQLMAMVRQTDNAIGLAFDGDADRLLAVDEEGILLDGDQIMSICAHYLLQKGCLTKQQMVVTSMSNLGLKLAMEKDNIRVFEAQVGDRYVLAKMLEIGAVMGGEQSGHIIFSEYNTTGDGLVSALMLLSIMQETGKSLKELAKIMVKMPQVLMNVPVKNKAWQESNAMLEAVKRAEQILAGSGRVLVRPSGTESLIRIMTEGPELTMLQEIIQEIAATASKELN